MIDHEVIIKVTLVIVFGMFVMYFIAWCNDGRS